MNKKEIIRKVVIAVIAAAVFIALLFCIPAVRNAARLPSAISRITAEAEKIGENYGMENISVSVISNNILAEYGYTHTYDLEFVSDTVPDLYTIRRLIQELNELQFGFSGDSKNPYIITAHCVLNGDKYTSYDGSLRKNNEELIRGAAPVSTTKKAPPKPSVTSGSSRYSPGYKYGGKKSGDPYGAADYADPEDFYCDYYDDFDSFEDAEDYYNDYN